jgi:hypothetical protein
VTSISELDSDEIQKLIADPYYNPEYKLATLTKWREFTATAVAHVEEQFSDFSPVFPSFQ